MSQPLFLKAPLGKPLGLVSPSFGPKGKIPTPPMPGVVPMSSLPGRGAPVRFSSDAADIRRSAHDAVGIDQAAERGRGISAYEEARAIMRASKSQGSTPARNIPADGLDTLADVKPLADVPSVDDGRQEQINRYKMGKLGTGVTFSQKKIFGSFEREVRKLRFKFRDTYKNMSKENWGQLESIIVPHATKRRTGSGYTLFDRRRMKREAWQLYRGHKISWADAKDFYRIIDVLE